MKKQRAEGIGHRAEGLSGDRFSYDLKDLEFHP